MGRRTPAARAAAGARRIPGARLGPAAGHDRCGARQQNRRAGL